tara:strand:- start:227 stop:547 length:321 start_codon:yes stop_codon:yes gene_type:complete
MSEWNYTKCAKPFASEEDALDFMVSNSYDGQVLKRDEGYSAVCPTYPDGFYPDATPVAAYSVNTGIIRDEKLFYIVMESNTNEKETIISEDCCPVPVATSTGEKCC